MTPEQRAELRRLCEAATPGPWLPNPKLCDVTAACPDGVTPSGVMSGVMSGVGPFVYVARVQEYRDVSFIAEARTALPALLDYVEKLEGEIERLKKEQA